MPRRKWTLNPPLAEEGPRENVGNAVAILWSIIEEPQLFSRDDVQEMVKAASVRLERALEQLGG